MMIGDTSGLATLINVFHTAPEHQQQMIAVWRDVGQGFERLPGFVAAALHRSTDGTRVINYAQWQSAADWQNSVTHNERQFARFKGLGAPDPHLYEVIYRSAATATTASPLTITQAGGLATVMNVFCVEPERQQRLIDTWIETSEQIKGLPGFVGAALHRSADGTRVADYVQWESAADWENMVKQSGQQWAKFQGLGMPDAHRYEVVYVSESPEAH